MSTMMQSNDGPDQSAETLASLSPLPILGLDGDGRVRLWNAAAETLFGWSRREIIGLPVPAIGEQERAAFFSSLTASLLRGETRVDAGSWKKKSGEPVQVEFSAARWNIPNATASGFLLVLTNLSEQRQFGEERAQLREAADRARAEAESAARYREVVEAAADAIVKVDANGRIVLVNRATELLFGYTREELVGQPVEIQVPQPYRRVHGGHRTAYSKNPVTRPMGHGMTLRALKKNGTEFPAEISLSPVQTGEDIRTLAIVRDVTERKRIEDQMRAMEHEFNQTLAAKNDELRIRNREIERADRLKSEFLASMSHELRTPLHTVIGFSQLLAEGIQGPLNEKQRRFVDHIHRDSQHLLELINDILDLSKIESGKIELRREIFEAISEVQGVAESISHAVASKSIRLEIAIDDNPVLNADKVRFREILFNLLSNALKFTPAGGRILVDTTPAESGFCCFRVQDTGIGIPDGQEEAIFDKFYQIGSTTKGVREGTGLGLSITRHLVELHGGRIWVRSEPGKGSCFSFTIPLNEKK